MKSLVTGGAGFIASHVVDELIKLGHEVVVIDDLSGGFAENVNPAAEFIKASITDVNVLEDVFSEYNFDYVYHLAAYAAEGLSHFIRNFNYTNNLIGSVNLINLSVKYGVKRFIYTSSIAVYGTNQLPMTEELTPVPEDPYGVSKYAVELDLKAANKMFGLNYTIFRPHNVYGSRQNHGDPYRNVLGIFINNILLNKPLVIFGNGKQSRAFTHVLDVAPYIAGCINVNGTLNEVFNIGSDLPSTIIEIANEICKEMGVESNIEFVPARKEVKHAYADHSKAKSVFGIKNTVKLNEGIKEMINWAKQRGPMQPKKFDNIEVNTNMPLSWKSLYEK